MRDYEYEQKMADELASDELFDTELEVTRLKAKLNIISVLVANSKSVFAESDCAGLGARYYLNEIERLLKDG